MRTLSGEVNNGFLEEGIFTVGFEGWVGVRQEENHVHFIVSLSKHVSLCTQPRAEQSRGLKSDMVSVLTEFLSWKEDKYKLLKCKAAGCFGWSS